MSDGLPVILDGVSGAALEIEVTFQPGDAARVGIRVYCDSDADGGGIVMIDLQTRTLVVGKVVAPFDPPSTELLVLRVFVAKHVGEAFANDRQAMVFFCPFNRRTLHTALIGYNGNALADISPWKNGID